jgi:hypothetical protein
VWEGDSQPGRAATCSKCDRDLHSCRNCLHHNPNLHNECRVSGTELVRERDRTNFCEHFEISSSNSKGTGKLEGGEARKKLDKLFGG